MNGYSVIISYAAKSDIKAAVDYIEFSLHNPVAADNLLDGIDEEVAVIKGNPFIYAIIDDPVLKACGLRFGIIKNYLLFYCVSANEKTITILRFLHGKMNWKSILRQSFTID